MLESFYPYLIEYLEERYKIVEDHLADGGETSIKATVLKQGIQNGLEKYPGHPRRDSRRTRRCSRERTNSTARPRSGRRRPATRRRRRGSTKLEAIVADGERTRRADFDRGYAFAARFCSRALSVHALGRGARARRTLDRKPGFQDRDMARARRRRSSSRAVRPRARPRRSSGSRSCARARCRVPSARGSRRCSALKRSEDRRGGDRQEARRLVRGRVARGREAAPRPARERHDRRSSRRRRIRSCAPRCACGRSYKAEEKKDDARTGELLLVAPLYTEALKQALGGRARAGRERARCASPTGR